MSVKALVCIPPDSTPVSMKLFRFCGVSLSSVRQTSQTVSQQNLWWLTHINSLVPFLTQRRLMGISGMTIILSSQCHDALQYLLVVTRVIPLRTASEMTFQFLGVAQFSLAQLLWKCLLWSNRGIMEIFTGLSTSSKYIYLKWMYFKCRNFSFSHIPKFPPSDFYLPLSF